MHFLPLNVTDKDSMLRLGRTIDKANGYLYGPLEDSGDALLRVAHDIDWAYMRAMDVQERYCAPVPKPPADGATVARADAARRPAD